MLATAEARFRTDLEREITIATTNRDWLTVERATLNLVFLTGEAPNEAALTELRLDHAPLLFTRNGALYQIGPDGGDQRLLFDQMPVAAPLWSPDREPHRLLFGRSRIRAVRGALHRGRRRGDNLQLVEAEAIFSLPAWSPDGTQLAFVGPDASDDGQPCIVFDLASKTTRVLPLPDGYQGATSPSWSSDGTRLAAIGLGSRGNNAILIVNVESMEASPLLESTPANARAVIWSPAADTLLLWTTTGESDWYALRGSAVYLVRIDDQAVVPVTTETQAPSRPVWAPDGACATPISHAGAPCTFACRPESASAQWSCHTREAGSLAGRQAEKGF